MYFVVKLSRFFGVVKPINVILPFCLKSTIEAPKCDLYGRNQKYQNYPIYFNNKLLLFSKWFI